MLRPQFEAKMVPKSTILLPAGLRDSECSWHGRGLPVRVPFHLKAAVSLLNSFLILEGAFQLPLLLPLTALRLCEVRGLYFKQMGK